MSTPSSPPSELRSPYSSDSLYHAKSPCYLVYSILKAIFSILTARATWSSPGPSPASNVHVAHPHDACPSFLSLRLPCHFIRGPPSNPPVSPLHLLFTKPKGLRTIQWESGGPCARVDCIMHRDAGISSNQLHFRARSAEVDTRHPRLS